ncbi:MAG: YdeI/OmpD-associated family protein [Bacteroidota bacterium]
MKNSESSLELWIGFYKKDSGRPTVTYLEAVDEALCFGWIDGIRKSIDGISFTNRFTPRKKTSHWSAVNIKRVGELKKLKLMQTSGLKAFDERNGMGTQQYSFEQRNDPKLPPVLLKQFKANKKAWQYFSSLAPWYQRSSIWWVISAKREETSLKRLNTLIIDSENGRTISLFTRKTYG